MKFKTLYLILLLSFTGILTFGCGVPKLGETPATVEETEKLLAKEQKKKNKIAKKEQKAAYKRFWSMQSKEARKSIKRNKKRQKKLARQRRG